MRLRDLLLDPWAPLSHKAPFARPGSGGTVREGPSWLPPRDRRRLTAYLMLRAYTLNVARAFVPEDPDSGEAPDDRREFGDPALVVKQTVAAILGEHQTITVAAAAGADEDDEAPPAGVEDPAQAEAREGRNAARAEARLAEDRRVWLEGWARDVRLPLKLLETERNAVGLGDGVYLLAWSPRRRRCDLTAVDPGFYFPVLPEGLADEYPERVHLAWELEADPSRNLPARVRRVTYELGPIRPATEVGPTPAGVLRRLVPFLSDVPPALLEGDAWDRDGRIVRTYPWSDAPSGTTCYLTECEWDLSERSVTHLYDLDPSAGRYLTNEDGELLDGLDLRLDFVPVVHVPNTVALADHYGESSLSGVLQLLDEVASSDTDESAASATTGNPPIGVSGVQLEHGSDGQPVRMTMGPGEVWGLGDNGRLSTVDTSPALAALAARVERLLDRLGTNSRLPGSVLGRNTADSPSGFHLLLTFAPYTAMVRELRLARQEKYPLLLRFAQRIAMAGGALPSGPVHEAELSFGSYLPTDLQSLVATVSGLVESGLLSLETGLRMLRDAGVPIGDVGEEAARIQSRDMARANLLADATNDQAAVRLFLGLEPPADLLPPVIDLPTGPAA